MGVSILSIHVHECRAISVHIFNLFACPLPSKFSDVSFLLQKEKKFTPQKLITKKAPKNYVFPCIKCICGMWGNVCCDLWMRKWVCNQSVPPTLQRQKEPSDCCCLWFSSNITKGTHEEVKEHLQGLKKWIQYKLSAFKYIIFMRTLAAVFST